MLLDKSYELLNLIEFKRDHFGIILLLSRNSNVLVPLGPILRNVDFSIYSFDGRSIIFKNFYFYSIGILLAIQGRKDYLMLQMVEGTMTFTVDNGRGPIMAVFKPDSKFKFCDGNWHEIHGKKK